MRWMRRAGAISLAGAVLFSCSSDQPPPPSSQAASSQAPGPVEDRGGSPSGPVVELDSLLTEVPEYQGQGRNLFAYGRDPRTAPAPTGPPVTTTSIPAPVTPRPTTPPPVRIDLQFAGFVEAPQAGGETKKYAVLLNGAEILTGAEGEMVANRYRIVEIGLESVTVSVEGSGGAQRIPLRTN